MIAPRNKLIALAAVVLLPLAIVLAVQPALWPLAVVLALLVMALALIDALRAPKLVSQVTIDPPTLVRLTKDVTGSATFTIHHPPHLRRLRLALQLPPMVETPHDALPVQLSGAEASRVEVQLLPRERGKFKIASAHWDMPSPWGLWQVKHSQVLTTEIRAYPNLLHERRKLAAIFLNRGNLGMHAQRRVGRGRDFERLREYMHGDSFEDIHWKATARRGKPVTKLYQVERTQEVYVVIDTSRLSARSTADPSGATTSQLERFIAAALTLGMVAERQGDLFGVVHFSDQVRGFVPARTGKAHFNACRESLYMLQPRLVHPDFEELFSFLRLRLRKRALLIILTNLDDPVLAESFARNIRLIQEHHLVLVSMIRIPGIGPIFSGPEPKSLPDVYAQLAGHLQWAELQEWQRRLKLFGVTLHFVESSALAPELVSQYVNVKQRQAL